MPVSDLQYASSRHAYRDPRSGERVVGVTTVLNSYSDGDKAGAMAGAAVKITRAGGDYRREWKAKRDLGTRIHTHVGDWALGKTADVLPSDEPYVEAFATFCKATTPTWLESERAVVHAAGYGGRFDLIGEVAGKWTLIDVKSGREYLPELTLQLAAYRFAEGMIRYDESGMAVGLDPMPYVERCAGLYLDSSGTARMVEVKADESAFDAFKHLLALRQWVQALKEAK